MDKISPISKQTVSDFEELHSKAVILEELITDRITYILKVLFSSFGGKLQYWYFQGAAESEVGDLSKYMDNNEIHGIYTDIINYEMPQIIDKFGIYWEYECAIPTRWLFEDFEKEIIDGKKKFEEENAR